MPKLTINTREVEVPQGSNLLDAIRSVGVTLPTLCYWEGLPAYGACRLCLVEMLAPRAEVVAACSYPVEDGMVVETHAERAQSVRKLVLEFMLARCPESAAIRDLARSQGVRTTRFQSTADPGELCVLCGLCVRVCRDAVGAAAISFSGRGSGRKVDSPFHLHTEDCIGCGACAAVCPTGAISIEDRGGERFLHTWNTVVRLQPCRICGKPYAPEPMAFLKEQDWATENSFVTCPSCRRKAAASQFDSARVSKGGDAHNTR
jgi:bidirectional [NiFe] hydrogenase diaphorase subunit